MPGGRNSTRALCVKKNGCGALRIGKWYRVISDREAEKEDMVRVVDDSEEDYLYPAELFRLVTVPTHIVRYLRNDL